MGERTFINWVEDPRVVTLAAVAAAAAAAWWATWLSMSAMDMEMMTMAPRWSAGNIIMTAIMWVLMMLAMMLPSMAPVMAIYARLASQESKRGALIARVTLFGFGYFALWAVASVALAVAQLGLAETRFFTMEGTQATPIAAAFLMVGAGLYQFTGIKDACLAHCRHPMTFLIGHWREGMGGAFPMGLRHGLYCVGCCIAFMGLMFVFGAMNVIWMAVIALYFMLEKVAPAAETWGRWVGAFLIAAGATTLAYVTIT